MHIISVMNEPSNPRTESDGNDENARLLRAQSIELRKGLEELMEHIHNNRHEESSESLQERYLLLVSTYPPECLKMAVTLTDVDVMQHEYESMESSSSAASLRLPIHLAFDKGAPLAIIQSLLEADTRKNGDHPSVTRADKWGDLPIHIACSRASAAISESDQRLYGMGLLPLENLKMRNYVETVESIRILLEADQSRISLSIKDVYESLPLHTAARYNAPPKVISILLEKSRSGLYTEGLHGQFPLTVACRSGDPQAKALALLLEHDDEHARANRSILSKSKTLEPSTVLHKDTTGRLPIHVFMLRNKCEQCLRILLEHMFGTTNEHGLASRNSILSTGLDAWKRQWLLEIIPAMDGKTLYERDFTTRDKLDVICAEARVVCEVCFGLELVTWKMSLLSGIRDEPDASTKLLEDTEWKQNRRIMSGAEVIVPNVLSFLEEEPVGRILSQFRSYGYLS